MNGEKNGHKKEYTSADIAAVLSGAQGAQDKQGSETIVKIFRALGEELAKPKSDQALTVSHPLMAVVSSIAGTDSDSRLCILGYGILALMVKLGTTHVDKTIVLDVSKATFMHKDTTVRKAAGGVFQTLHEVRQSLPAPSRSALLHAEQMLRPYALDNPGAENRVKALVKELQKLAAHKPPSP